MSEPSRDFLYAIGRQDPWRSSRRVSFASIKIGRSWSPDERIVALRHQAGRSHLWIVAALPRMGTWEKAVHAALEPWEVGGEWFDHIVLIAALRWGLPALVSWALDDGNVPCELRTFMSSTRGDIEDAR